MQLRDNCNGKKGQRCQPATRSSWGWLGEKQEGENEIAEKMRDIIVIGIMVRIITVTL